jgi:Chaperone of endosialidase
MYRVDNATSADPPAPPPTALGKAEGYFTGGNPGVGLAATILEAEWLNMIQEEGANLVLSAGLALDKADRTQWAQAIDAKIAGVAIPAGTYVLRAGDTMLGFLTANADPVQPLHYATKNYVDGMIAGGGLVEPVGAGNWGRLQTGVWQRAVAVAGDVMTGFLTLDADPTAPLHAATKQYVDTHLTQAEADPRYVNVAGDTMTGFLTANADPTAPLHYATKQYIDAAFVLKAGDTMTGSLVIGTFAAPPPVADFALAAEGNIYSSGGVFAGYPTVTEFHLNINEITLDRGLNFSGNPGTPNNANIVWSPANGDMRFSTMGGERLRLREGDGAVVAFGGVFASYAARQDFGLIVDPTTLSATLNFAGVGAAAARLLWDSTTGDVTCTTAGGWRWMAENASGTFFAATHLTIGTAAGIGEGTKPVGPAWANPSDASIKKAITNYTTGLAAILQLRPVSFQFNGNGGFPDDGQTHVGLVADEVEGVFPDAVGTMSVKMRPDDIETTEIKSLQFSEIAFAQLNAFKEIDARLRALEAARQA